MLNSFCFNVERFEFEIISGRPGVRGFGCHFYYPQQLLLAVRIVKQLQNLIKYVLFMLLIRSLMSCILYGTFVGLKLLMLQIR